MGREQKKLKPRILDWPSADWPAFAAETIGQTINSVIAMRRTCNVMLAGGNSVKPVYEKWALSSTFPFEKIEFFFGDERCVPPVHPDSNYNMVMESLFVKGKPFFITRMEAENPDSEAASREYEKVLPKRIDVLLLGVGVDGHIASLFPHDPLVLSSGHRSVVPVRGPKPPENRLTITPEVIANAESIFVLAKGKEKGKVLAEALKSSSDILSLPVRLTLKGTWLLDAEAKTHL